MIKALSYINLCICISCLKLLLLKSYVSTDFDVHRNWMSITYNLPIKEWYFDETSEWTLDYPPLFAAFEFLLALIANFLNFNEALLLTKEPIRSESVIIYQKLTVIFSDFLYYYAIYRLCQAADPIANKLTLVLASTKRKQQIDTHQPPGQAVANEENKHQSQNLLDSLFRPDITSSTALLLLFQPGLLIVDHVHFQYNGLLSGILLISIANIISQNYISGAFWFAILLNFKHIYLYCAPAYGMYLLTCYCMTKSDKRGRIASFIVRATSLAIVVALVFIITYIPFAQFDQLRQIVSRLFPFKRGLTHAYWAPNIWALYNTADKILATVFKDSLNTKFDLDSISRAQPISSTSGLVQEYEHQYLPTIRPMTTLALVTTFTIPLATKFLISGYTNKPNLFMKAVTLSAFTAFMFGWHVHEKAIILILLPLIPISFLDLNLKTVLRRLTLTGTYSLFPLLFTPAEYFIKITLLIAYHTFTKSLCLQHDYNSQIKADKGKPVGIIRSIARKLYKLIDISFILGIIMIEFYTTLVHGNLNYGWNPLAVLNKYEFLPLMLISSFSALGITYSYLELYYDFVFGADEVPATTSAILGFA